MRHKEHCLQAKRKLDSNPEPHPFPNRNQQSHKDCTHNPLLPIPMDCYLQSAPTWLSEKENISEQNTDTCPVPLQANPPHQWIDDSPASNVQTDHASTRFFRSFRSFRPSAYHTFQSIAAFQGGNRSHRATGQSIPGMRHKRTKNQKPQSAWCDGPPESCTSSAPRLMGLNAT
jgi:hypothetical protein